MSVLRTFVAIEIPHDIHEALDRESAPLRARLNASLVRWVPTGNIHLTLKFLGDTPSRDMESLGHLLDELAAKHTGFNLKVSGLGAFPNLKRPRVIWVGIQAPDELEALQRGIEAATARLGYPEERRRFSPHLTIGRVKRKVAPGDLQVIRSVLEEHQFAVLGSAAVTAVQLFKSELKPTGAVYTRLHSAPLGKA